MFIKEQRVNANEIYVKDMHHNEHHWTKAEIFSLIQSEGSAEAAVAAMKAELASCCAGSDYITLEIEEDGTPVELGFQAPTGDDE
jgi:hypothetical protein